MLELDPAFEEALLDESVDKHVLVLFGLNPPWAICTAPRDITFDGVTYAANGPLVSAGGATPRGGDVRRTQYAITMVDDSTSSWGRVRNRKRLLDGGVLIPVAVRMVADGVADQALELFVGRTSGEPATDRAGEFVVPCVGRFRQLTGRRSFLLTKDAQRQRDDTDDGLDEVHLAKDLDWGLRDE